MKKLCLQADASAEGQRIDKYLAVELSDYSRSFLQKQLKEGNVTIGEKAVKSSYQLSEEEEITVLIPDNKEPDIEPENIPLSILYEDEQLLVVDKPKGMVVHPSAGHYSGTLVNALLYHCKGNLSGINGVLRPGIVHRIDKDTTGALLVCKTDLAHRDLAQQLKEHSITRRYRAIVHGNLKEEEGTIEGAIGRHPTERKKMAINLKNGKPAVTHYKVLEHYENYSYIECRLETGRTHQIRVHMSSIDILWWEIFVYGLKNVHFKSGGQTLHAMVLGFVHPVTKEYLNLQHRFHNILKNYKKTHIIYANFIYKIKKIDYNKYNQKHQWRGVHEYDESYSYYNRKTARKWW